MPSPSVTSGVCVSPGGTFAALCVTEVNSDTERDRFEGRATGEHGEPGKRPRLGLVTTSLLSLNGDASEMCHGALARLARLSTSPFTLLVDRKSMIVLRPTESDTRRRTSRKAHAYGAV